MLPFLHEPQHRQRQHCILLLLLLLCRLLQCCLCLSSC
jgi:hypothetical protein